MMAKIDEKYTTAQPYLAVFIVLRKKNKIAFVMRSTTAWMNGYFGLPSGKVEKNESFLAAAIREAQEEIGIGVKPKDLKYVHTVHRHEPSSFAQDWVDVYFEAIKWSGQPYNAEPSRHSELAWLDPLKLPKNVVPSVRFALNQIQAGKVYSEYGWK